MAFTSHDVARRAGVSQSTVSRVLNGDARVKLETRERVLRVLDEMDFRPNPAARAMKTGRSGAIGVTVSRLTNPYYPELLDAVGEAAVESGCQIVVWNTDARGDVAAARALRDGTVDGVILTTATTSGAEIWRQFPSDAPIVLVNRVVEDLPFAQFTGDHAAGAGRVADLFLDSEKRNLGLITAPRAPSTTREREDGFLAHVGETADLQLVRCAEVSHEEGRRAIRELMERPNPPEAVFCVSDLLALGVIDGAREAGIEVPDQLWVAGFDDVALAAWGSYQLTTVRQPASQMARRAVQALLQQMAKPQHPAGLTRLPVELVIRGSARSWD